MGKNDLFDGTSTIIFFMLVYGFIAMCSTKISFIWQLAVGAILLVFIIETIINILWRKNK